MKQNLSEIADSFGFTHKNFCLLIFKDINHIVTTFLVFSVLLSGCATTTRPDPQIKSQGADYEVVAGTVERGLSSWYGPGYRGKATASGELFNPDDLTAAHRTLRFGTIVEVRNLKNNRTVLVTINDRGPFVKGRIIDVSEQAAKALGMIAEGVVPVEIRTMRRVQR